MPPTTNKEHNLPPKNYKLPPASFYLRAVFYLITKTQVITINKCLSSPLIGRLRSQLLTTSSCCKQLFQCEPALKRQTSQLYQNVSTWKRSVAAKCEFPLFYFYEALQKCSAKVISVTSEPCRLIGWVARTRVQLTMQKRMASLWSAV